ncbi:nucleolar transcription factor 1 [Caerostris extrusa]|uniref:Nucleolar transcription factor 1 n=1 Tax=Caerostris extrusa TaxID=172846 RepID=A0AAV4P1H1_CAEEX|nr:nucleolar transcription factor 1 [Caerostris extrusa]
MASTEISGRRKASKRPFPAAASEPSTNGPVQATDLSPVAAKKSKPNHESAPSKSKSRKENDGKCSFISIRSFFDDDRLFFLPMGYSLRKTITRLNSSTFFLHVP